MSQTKEIAVSVKDIHKNFILPQSKDTSLKQAAVNIVKKNKKVTQKVLDGVNFDIYEGDFFGIVGRNGSGKSTLLKLLAGVYVPTSGSVGINGGLTPFIQLGVGFNVELSGKDNVYLNGALLGFTRRQMDEIYDEIVDFAELGPFMDQKLKNYSSGMQVRLAFSIAIKAKNDILIFDEVLAVGDEAFQRKCLDVFEKYKASGQTVILVTHDMDIVRKFCNRSILLSDGKILSQKSPEEIALLYSSLNQEVIAKHRKNDPLVSGENINVTIRDKKKSYAYNDTIAFDIKFGKTIGMSEVESVGVTIVKQTGEHIGGLNSRVAGGGWKKGREISLTTKTNFSHGVYYGLVELFSNDGTRIGITKSQYFDVVYPSSKEWSGLFKLSGDWK